MSPVDNPFARPPGPLEHQRALLDDARFELRRAAVAAKDARAKAGALSRSRDDRTSDALDAALEAARQAQAKLSRARERAATERKSLVADLTRHLAPSAEEEVQRLSAQAPLVLLPVRIETRFAGATLQLRVYPDDILADTFEPELTDQEIDDGRTFWEAAWPGETEERAAWRTLIGKSDQQRAAWIARAMTPLNIADRPTGTPNPPSPARRESTWTRPAETWLLPDRWHVVLETPASRRVVSGSAIVEPLALTFSPDPSDPRSPLGPDGLELSDEARWTVDFARAIDVGMAMTIALEEGERQGLTRLIVFGVKSSLAADVSAASLQELLEHHRFGRGVALVPQGTPTNNTSAGPAPFPPPDNDGQRGFAVERIGVPVVAGRDGARLMSALGLAPDSARHLEGADGREFERAGAMARALWQVTWGYFLTEQMAPVFDDAEIESARRFFVNHVRGRGPYAAFRIGNTLYGVLPVSSLASWQPGARDGVIDRALPAALRGVRNVWLSKAPLVPRVGRTGDPDRDLMEILGMDASAREVRVRAVTGEDATWNLMGFWGWGDVWAAWSDAGQAMAQTVLNLIGHPEWKPRIGRVNFDPKAWPFRYKLVTESPVSESGALTPNYIEWIRTASLSDLMTEQLPAGWEPPVSLLYRLLRHSALLEYHNAAFRLELRHAIVQPAERTEREIQGLAAQPAQFDRVQHLLLNVPAVTGQQPVHAYLSNPANAATIVSLFPDAPVVGFRDALAALSGASPAELERLFGETLDVASHRLDAWITALASKRLESMRTGVPAGCHLGAFGWVEDLRPKPDRRARTVDLEDGRVAARQAGNGGYVQAPSMMHAAAAAILRSGYLSRSGADQRKYAVDLSSARVRAARFVLDAVREGQPVGAVFGYQFERGLHDRNLDKWIAAFRARYPLVAAKTGDPDDFDPANPDQPKEHIAARNVVDGLVLRTAFQDGTVPWGQFGLPTGADRTSVEQELAALDRTVDSVSDLLLAEGVYQIVKGSPSVAAATLDAMAQGAVRPPDPEIATQPHAGTPLTHRVVLLAGGNGPALPAGYVATATPRAVLEPCVDAWLGSVFGPAAAYRAQVIVTPNGSGPLTTTVSLAALHVRPVDVLAMTQASADAPAGATTAAASELDRRVIEAAHAALGLTQESKAQIEYKRPVAGFNPAQDRTFADLLDLVQAVETVLSKSRPLTPEDLVAEDRADAGAAADHRGAEAVTRAGQLLQAVDLANQTLNTAVAAAKAAADSAPFALAGLRSALRAMAEVGVTGSYPVSSLGDTLAQRRDLITQGESVTAEATRRIEQATALRTEAQKPQHANDARFLLTSARAIVDAVAGARTPFLPRFDPPEPAELANALAHHATAAFIDSDQASRRTAVRRFERIAAAVRPGLDAWRRLEILTGTLGRIPSPRVVAQLPYDASARWVALPFASESDRPKSGRTSLLLYQADTPAATAPWAGLVIDQWIEMIPMKSVQTGVAFHYDDPGAEAPQAVLVAVPPVPDSRTWQLPWVIDAIREAAEMARIRGVDGELLGELGQLLPAITLTDSTDEVTIRSSFVGTLLAEARITERFS